MEKKLTKIGLVIFCIAFVCILFLYRLEVFLNPPQTPFLLIIWMLLIYISPFFIIVLCGSAIFTIITWLIYIIKKILRKKHSSTTELVEEVPSKKLTKLQWILITIAITVIIIIIFGTAFIASSQNGIREKKFAAEYLSYKYDKDFNLEFIKGGHPPKKGFMECGNDYEIKQYVYRVTSDDSPIISYCTLYRNVKTGELEIFERCEHLYGYTDLSYEKMSGIYNEKLTIKPELENILTKHYSPEDYSINYFAGDNKEKIEIAFPQKMTEDIENLLSITENIIFLLQDRDVMIDLNYHDDFILTLSKEKTIKKPKEMLIATSLVYDFMEKNYTEIFLITSDLYSYGNIKIELPIDISKKYDSEKTMYENIHTGLTKLSKENSITILLYFNGNKYNVQYSDYHSYDYQDNYNTTLKKKLKL